MAKNKAVSWALSIIIHATGLVMILVAGFHIAAPEGSVTDKTEFEAVGNPAPPTNAAPAAPIPAPPQEQPQVPSQPPQQDEAPPPQKTVDEAPPLETQPDAEAPPVPEEPVSQNDPTSDTAAAPSEAQNPNPLPIDAASPVPEATGTPTPGENSAAVTASPVPAAIPATTPTEGTSTADATQKGATIDESKLTEAFGNHKPSYPYMARLRRQQGTVILHAYVNADGSVNQVTVSTSSGFPSIDEEARTTYGRWQYQPGLTGWVIKPFKFSLK
jgi:protein TonB